MIAVRTNIRKMQRESGKADRVMRLRRVRATALETIARLEAQLSAGRMSAAKRDECLLALSAARSLAFSIDEKLRGGA